MQKELTSIIILAYKEPEIFKKMFETLLLNTHQEKTPFEIIVIGNNCDKEIEEYIKTQLGFIIMLFKENLGTSRAFNIGANIAKGKYICFFNSDYYMEDNWLENMIDCFEHKPNIGLIGCMTNITGNKWEECEALKYLPIDYIQAPCATAQMFTTKEIWKEVGGFDENIFFSHEDLDFSLMMKEKGYKIFVNRKCFGYHDHKSKIKQLCEGHIQVDKSRIYFRNKWKEKAKEFLWA